MKASVRQRVGFFALAGVLVAVIALVIVYRPGLFRFLRRQSPATT